MENLRNATLVFLVKKTDGAITDVCLAMKKRGFGKDRWNGVGGKVESGETVESAARRETQEEIGVEVGNLCKVAELTFLFSHNPSWDQRVHVFFVENWQGVPTESEEMNPRWFAVDEIPYEHMWPDDIMWLPDTMRGCLLRCLFCFGEDDTIQNSEINVVQEL